ncbi:hypothetical protein BESB_024940 [Besnoitia besnoiti]|uniref:Transmembrane protein n=1 Tax=Besnoitia besnoiti TaxID=94643 RepID=A0A2A9LYK8_BESBE|nr:uncharacterized protein BESB_024940 [Besnoitia besnoiti]PFH31528.1 hypothetical protein BESB_024940 [Besnoitia besnoiti]
MRALTKKGHEASFSGGHGQACKDEEAARSYFQLAKGSIDEHLQKPVESVNGSLFDAGCVFASDTASGGGRAAKPACLASSLPLQSIGVPPLLRFLSHRGKSQAERTMSGGMTATCRGKGTQCPTTRDCEGGEAAHRPEAATGECRATPPVSSASYPSGKGGEGGNERTRSIERTRFQRGRRPRRLRLLLRALHAGASFCLPLFVFFFLLSFPSLLVRLGRQLGLRSMRRKRIGLTRILQRRLPFSWSPEFFTCSSASSPVRAWPPDAVPTLARPLVPRCLSPSRSTVITSSPCPPANDSSFHSSVSLPSGSLRPSSASCSPSIASSVHVAAFLVHAGPPRPTWEDVLYIHREGLLAFAQGGDARLLSVRAPSEAAAASIDNPAEEMEPAELAEGLVPELSLQRVSREFAERVSRSEAELRAFLSGATGGTEEAKARQTPRAEGAEANRRGGQSSQDASRGEEGEAAVKPRTDSEKQHSGERAGQAQAADGEGEEEDKQRGARKRSDPVAGGERLSKALSRVVPRCAMGACSGRWQPFRMPWFRLISHTGEPVDGERKGQEELLLRDFYEIAVVPAYLAFLENVAERLLASFRLEFSSFVAGLPAFDLQAQKLRCTYTRALQKAAAAAAPRTSKRARAFLRALVRQGCFFCGPCPAFADESSPSCSSFSDSAAVADACAQSSLSDGVPLRPSLSAPLGPQLRPRPPRCLACVQREFEFALARLIAERREEGREMEEGRQAMSREYQKRLFAFLFRKALARWGPLALQLLWLYAKKKVLEAWRRRTESRDATPKAAPDARVSRLEERASGSASEAPVEGA